MAGAVALIALGLLAAFGSAMAWTGRWRSWSRQVILGLFPLPLGLLPAVAAICLLVGLDEAGAVSSNGPAGGIAVLVMFGGLILTFWGPRWFGPRWYREQDSAFRGAKPSPENLDLSDAPTALAYGAVQPDEPRKLLPERFRGKPINSWRGTLVERDEPGMRNAMARNGRVEGRLSLYEAGVTFAAEGLPTKLERAPEPILLDADELLDVRVVKAGAGPDGKKRRHTGPRSLFKRLVIDTPSGPLLFEVQRAAKVREEITGAL
jgi:hypothetical protein